MGTRMTLSAARIGILLCCVFTGLLATACEQQAEAETQADTKTEPVTLVADASSDDFSMPIMDVFNITGRGTVLTGKVLSGAIEVNDTVCIPLTSGEVLARNVDGIEQFRKMLDRAEAGEHAGILVNDVDRKMVEKGASLNTDCD